MNRQTIPDTVLAGDAIVRYVVWRKGDEIEETGTAWSKPMSIGQVAEAQAVYDKDMGKVSMLEWPITYCVRVIDTGAVWSITLTCVIESRIKVVEAAEIKLAPAVHVLWGDIALCEDKRLALHPNEWPPDQLWRTVGAVANDDEDVPVDDRCVKCWEKAPKLIATLREVMVRTK